MSKPAPAKTITKKTNKPKSFIIVSALLIFLILASVLGLILVNNFSDSPQNSEPEEVNPEIEIQTTPTIAHHHLRLSLNYRGQEIDFGSDDFQEGYTDDVCNGQLTSTPIHFHDNINHLVHIHWGLTTGGQILKYYGLNLVGGDDGILEYQLDNNPENYTVSVHGNLLAKPEAEDNFWIYTGDSQEYTERNLEDFLNQDLETFFGQKSSLTIQREQAQALKEENQKLSWLNFLSPQAKAHGSEDKSKIYSASGELLENREYTQEELKEINDLLGDVVIFIQPEKPSDNQIQTSFRNLTPLEPSSCGG